MPSEPTPRHVPRCDRTTRTPTGREGAPTRRVDPTDRPTPRPTRADARGPDGETTDHDQ